MLAEEIIRADSDKYLTVKVLVVRTKVFFFFCFARSISVDEEKPRSETCNYCMNRQFKSAECSAMTSEEKSLSPTLAFFSTVDNTSIRHTFIAGVFAASG